MEDGYYWALWEFGQQWEPVEVRQDEVWVLGKEYSYEPKEFVAFQPMAPAFEQEGIGGTDPSEG